MNASSKMHDDWRHVATVEIVDTSDAFAHVIDNHPSCYRVERREGCPAGCSKFAILVEFGLADRQAAHAAYAVLKAAEHAAREGNAHGYRVVSAPYWDELAYILGHDGADVPLPLPDASLAHEPVRARRAAAPARPATARDARPLQANHRARSGKHGAAR